MGVSRTSVRDRCVVPAAPRRRPQYWWYYCPDSQTFYPHVQQCASEWQRVLPQPAPQ